MKKNIALLGSTGSIGKQTLQVVSAFPDDFTISVLTANNNADLLIAQAIKYQPNVVVIGNETLYDKVYTALDSLDIKVYAGEKAIADVVTMNEIHIVLTALVGYAGLIPTINAIKAGKTIALANKETLVVAGDIVTKLALEHNTPIIPVDSEHSAIFQCLMGEQPNTVSSIHLTASGGPFRGKKTHELITITKEAALKHPNWEMGAKITIDSATMMNKGLEVIEAKWLFQLTPEKIQVIVHPQSIIHSLVEFNDGSLKAHMGVPDMQHPIQYALTFPFRKQTTTHKFSFLDHPNLSFEQPDKETFRNLELAYNAMNKGGNMACILNAANEITVDAFLKDRISFLDIAKINEKCMEDASFIAKPTLEDYILSNEETRKKCKELCFS